MRRFSRGGARRSASERARPHRQSSVLVRVRLSAANRGGEGSSPSLEPPSFCRTMMMMMMMVPRFGRCSKRVIVVIVIAHVQWDYRNIRRRRGCRRRRRPTTRPGVENDASPSTIGRRRSRRRRRKRRCHLYRRRRRRREDKTRGHLLYVSLSLLVASCLCRESSFGKSRVGVCVVVASSLSSLRRRRFF